MGHDYHVHRLRGSWGGVKGGLDCVRSHLDPECLRTFIPDID